MRPAPSLDCTVCGRTIAQRSTHYLLGKAEWYDDDVANVTSAREHDGDLLANVRDGSWLDAKGFRPVLCSRCVEARALHARFYPACSERWHDLFDHPVVFGTRAGAARVLGLRQC